MEARGNHTDSNRAHTAASEGAGFYGSDLISGSLAASDGRVLLSSPAAISRSRMA